MQNNIQKVFLTSMGLLLFFLVPIFSFAQNDSQETIQSFQSDIVINTDGSTDVIETIVYDFGTNERHGIYREIPLTTVAGAVRPLRIQNISVTDEMGNVYTTNLTTGNPTNIRIGDADRTISGVHTYVISYHTENAIGFFDSFDELYWNVTGNEWEIPILAAQATITLPGKFSTTDLRIKEYCGFSGNSQPCGESIVTTDMNTKIVFNNSKFQEFTPGQGMTIAVGFPKGIIAPAVLHWWEKESLYMTIAILLGIFFVARFFWWLFRSYLPEYRACKKPIIAEYTPLQGLTAGEAACIYKYTTLVPMPEIMMAEILYLASQGYVTIRKTKEKNHWWERESFGFTRTSKIIAPGTLSHHLEDLLHEITFADREKTLEDLKQEQNYYSFQAIAFKVYASANTKNGKKIDDTGVYFFSKARAGSAFSEIIMVGLVFIFLGLALAAVEFSFFTMLLFFGAFGIFIVLSVIKNTLLSYIKGKTDLWYHVAGLREYIIIAEKDRINFASDPEKASQVFSELLPFAVAFHLEKKWAALFEGILSQNPSWYQSADSTFSARRFSTSLTAFSMGMIASSSSGQPVSSGGGSGGGGSSGGGGGGGGGGSW